MPRIKKTKKNEETTHSQKGSSAGRKKAAKASNSASVAEMLQVMNSKASSSSGDNTASSSPSAPASASASASASPSASAAASASASAPASASASAAASASASAPASASTSASASASASRSSSGPMTKRPEERGRAGRSQKRGERMSEGAGESQGDQQQRAGKRTGRGGGTGPKRKPATSENKASAKGATPSSPTKRKRRTGRQESLDDSSFLERQVSAQSLAKWQSLSKTSQEFLQQLTDSAIADVLTETSDSNYSDIQDHLNNLKRRLMSAVVSLKVPNKRQPNYRDMEGQMQVLEAALVEASNQVECLDKEVQLQQELLREKEEELQNLEATDQEESLENQQEVSKRLHPILQEDQEDVLGLPPLRRQRDHPSPHQFDGIRSSCQQPVLEALQSMSQTQTDRRVPEITEFIDVLAAIQASLPE